MNPLKETRELNRIDVEAKSHNYKRFSYIDNKYCNNYDNLSIAEY